MRVPNELNIGDRRYGTLIDFDDSTPHVNVTLERDKRGIRLTISWPDYESPFAAWFVSGKYGLPASETSPPATPVPKNLLFQDSHGLVLLVGCWKRGFRSSVFGPGTGFIRARYAIFNVEHNTDFRYVNGLKTEVTGLRDWLEISSVQRDFETRSAEHPIRLIVTASSDDSLSVASDPPFRFIPSWSVSTDEDRVVVGDLLRVETTHSELIDVRDAEKLHLAMRDLLVLSHWRAEICIPLAVMRRDDPDAQDFDGKYGDYWRDLVPAVYEKRPKARDTSEHLILFSEVGLAGLEKWIKLRDEFARALDPVVSTRFLDGVSATSLLAQTGPAIEALGYLLFLRDGKSADQAARAYLRSRLDRIAREVAGVMPFDVAEWAAETVIAYNAVKHANRILPAEVDVLNRWRESVLITRVWVALELGSDRDELRKRIVNSPQSSPYSVVAN